MRRIAILKAFLFIQMLVLMAVVSMFLFRIEIPWLGIASAAASVLTLAMFPYKRYFK